MGKIQINRRALRRCGMGEEVAVEPANMIIAALTAGAAAGVSDSIASGVRDAYDSLRALIRCRLGADEEAQAALEEHGRDPSASEPLLSHLVNRGVADDPEIRLAAEHLTKLTGQYSRVVVRDSKGVQVGDCNTQNNVFS